MQAYDALVRAATHRGRSARGRARWRSSSLRSSPSSPVVARRLELAPARGMRRRRARRRRLRARRRRRARRRCSSPATPPRSTSRCRRVEVLGLLYPFGSTIDLVRAADLAVANHEAPITDGGTPSPLYKKYVYRAPPASARALADAGFDVARARQQPRRPTPASTASPTPSPSPRAPAWRPIGAGATPPRPAAASSPTSAALRVGLLAYCERQLLFDAYIDQFARAHRAGVAMAAEPDARPRHRPPARRRRRARRRQLPRRRQLRATDARRPPWAERAIDDGADLVIDHHPHVAHPIAMYRGRAIALSLGNYAFGTPGRFYRRADPDMLDLGLLASPTRAAARAAAPRSIDWSWCRWRCTMNACATAPSRSPTPSSTDALARLREMSARARRRRARRRRPRRRHARRVCADDPDLVPLSRRLLDGHPRRACSSSIARTSRTRPSPSASSTSAPSGRSSASPSASGLLADGARLLAGAARPDARPRRRRFRGIIRRASRSRILAVALCVAGCVDTKACHTATAWKPCAGADRRAGRLGHAADASSTSSCRPAPTSTRRW